MDSFVDLIKKIGIFIIAAQALIHFAPGQKYEKYIKMIVSVMILLLFLAPVYRIFTKTEMEWESQVRNLEQELSERFEEELDGSAGSDSVSDAVIRNVEKEIKSKLNTEIETENYFVDSVRVTIKTEKTADAESVSAYALDTVRVVVRARAEPYSEEDSSGKETQGETQSEMQKIQIQKITVGQDGAAGNNDGKNETDPAEEREKAADKLRERFCAVLGMEEAYMEVAVYGGTENFF